MRKGDGSMESQNVKRKAWIRFLLVLLFCSTITILFIGTAYARFEESISQEMKFSYHAKTDQLYIRVIENSESATAAEKKEDLQVIEFLLSNGEDEKNYCDYDQVATLLLFATLGLENPEDLKITLNDGADAYTAKCQPVTENSVYYSMYGPGWIYQFYNSAGEELNWHFSGTNYIERKMFIMIEGTSNLPVNLNLIVNGKPGIV